MNPILHLNTSLRALARLLAIGSPLVALTLLAEPAHAAPGDLDSLNANLVGEVQWATAVQPDGKTIIAGTFTSVLGVPRSNIARLNADGTLDMGFDPKTNGTVYCVAVQADGKVLLGGDFGALQPNGAVAATARNRIARVNADGSLDAGFDPNASGGVTCVAVQADGKVLLGGYFLTLRPNGAVTTTARSRIARVNADGTLDTGFDPNPSEAVLSVAVQADGKVLLGGYFGTLQPNGAGAATARQGIARVNADGTVDTSFNPKANNVVNCVAVQADGKVLLGGDFTTLQPNGAVTATARNHIARVNAGGTLDTGFDPKANGSVQSVAVQADGKVLLGGFFTTLQPNGAVTATARNRIARVNAGGTLDMGFDPNASSNVFGVAVQADGKVLFGGWFTTLQPNGAGAATARNHFARLENDPATQTLTVPDATQALWQRGGAGPELSRVAFDLSTDGGANWTPLGPGTRIGSTTDWKFTGPLSGSGSLRARGATAGGFYNGSSGLIEQVTTFSGFPISNNANLSALTTTAGALTPTFTAATTAYTASVVYGRSPITVTPTNAQGNATIQVRVNGGTYAGVTSGSPSGALALNVGTNLVDVLVTAHDGVTTKTYTVTVTRAAPAAGDLDPLDANIVGNVVYATVVQPDGKTIIAGDFTSVLGVARSNIARLNADGTLDMGFDPKANAQVYSVAVQADGEVLLVGSFTTLQPNGAVAATARNRIARVNADGTLDAGFDPHAGGSSATVLSVAVQADGKVLLGGDFLTLQPNGAGTTTTRQGIARVNADGTLDTGFNPNPNNFVQSVAVQADGKVLLGGGFTALQPNGAVSGTTRNYIARVNADGTLDTGFNPNPSYFVVCVAVQADGKVLLGGSFSSVSGTLRNYIARINANGTLDTGFDPMANDHVFSVAVQADGKVLLGGAFTSLQPNGAGAATARNYIARVNANGTLDTGFDPKANDLVDSIAVQADGEVLLGGAFTSLQPNGSVSPTARTRFVRLVNDPTTQTLSTPDASQVLWMRGGAEPELSRVTFELSTDGGANWTPLGAGTRIGTTANWQGIVNLPTSGHVRARGRTTQSDNSGLIEQVAPFSGLTLSINANLSALTTTAGALTPTFAPATVAYTANVVYGTSSITVTPTAAQANATIQVRVNGGTYASVTSGSLSDPLALNVGANLVDVLVTAQDGTTTKTYTVTVTRIAPTPGDLDPLDATLVGNFVRATAVQPDGKTIIAGTFTSVLGVARSNIARLNADGTLDMDFNPKANLEVDCVAVQADGKVLLGGLFTTLQPNGAVAATARNRIARVNADGTLDTGFDPKADNSVTSVAVQSDGKVLLGGTFTTLQPNGAVAATARNRIARVNADGTLDTGFDPKADNSVTSVAVQSDGKVLLGGTFTTLQPNGAGAATARSRIARVNADGTLDTGFDPKANATVNSVVVQADGKVLLGGDFTTLQPNGAAATAARQRIARVNADGTLDTGFDPKASATVFSVAVQADGKVLLGGDFLTLQPNGTPATTARQRIARVNADGTLDTGFDPKANSTVNSVAVQADGKVLLGGAFTMLQPNGSAATTARNRFARLLNDPAIQTLSAPDATQVLWQRGGGAPELSRVTFELSTDGGANWAPLSAGTRIGTTPNWQITGLSLSASGSLRARGTTAGGYQNGSSGLIEQVTTFTFTFYTPLQQWKLTHLGDANASDLGDDDGDGIRTLAEYGLNLLPETPNGAPLIVTRFTYAEGERLRVFIQREPVHNDVTIEVQAAASPAGPWTLIATSTFGAPFSGLGYVGGDDATTGVKTIEIRDTVNIADAPARFLRARILH